MSTFQLVLMFIVGMQKFVRYRYYFFHQQNLICIRLHYTFPMYYTGNRDLVMVTVYSESDARNFRLGINLKLRDKEDECSLSSRTSLDHSSDIQHYIAATGTSEGKYKNTKLLCPTTF